MLPWPRSLCKPYTSCNGLAATANGTKAAACYECKMRKVMSPHQTKFSAGRGWKEKRAIEKEHIRSERRSSTVVHRPPRWDWYFSQKCDVEIVRIKICKFNLKFNNYCIIVNVNGTVVMTAAIAGVDPIHLTACTLPPSAFTVANY